MILQISEKEYAKGVEELEAGRKAYEEGVTAYNKGLEEYNAGVKKYENGLAEFEKAKNKLEKGWKEYEDGLAEYEKGFLGSDAGDGVIGTLNSEVKTTEQAILELKHDTALMSQIRERSKAQIALLIYSLVEKDIKVQGVWESGERR